MSPRPFVPSLILGNSLDLKLFRDEASPFILSSNFFGPLQEGKTYIKIDDPADIRCISADRCKKVDEKAAIVRNMGFASIINHPFGYEYSEAIIIYLTLFYL